MKIFAKYLLGILLFASITPEAQLQPVEGYPFVVNYTRGVDYFGSLQTWGITRDANGILLFGNSSYGIQQFDGTHWRNIETPANAQATSFANDTEGNVFAGNLNSFGTIGRDETGSYIYESLTQLLPDSLQDVRQIRHVATSGPYVYFLSSETGYRYHKEDHAIVVFYPEGIFTGAAQTDSDIWIYDSVRGLLRAGENGELVNVELYEGVSDGNHKLVILNGNPAVVTQDFSVWTPGLDEWRETPLLGSFAEEGDAGVDAAVGLYDGSIAIANVRGVFVYDASGAKRYHFTTRNGLTADHSYNLFQDDEGVLWVTGGNGISGIEIGRPMREFLPSQGLPEDGIRFVSEYNGQVFIGTEYGVYVGKEGSFEQFLDDQVIFSFQEIPAGMLIAASDGLYLWNSEGNLSRPYADGRVIQFGISRLQEDLFYFQGVDFNLYVMYIGGDGSFTYRQLFLFDYPAHTIFEDRYGDIWVGTGRHGIFQLSIDQAENGQISVKEHRVFTTEDGLPTDRHNFTKRLPDDVGFITTDGFYRLSEDRERIIKDTRFTALFGDGGFGVWPVSAGRDGQSWVARSASLIGKTSYDESLDTFDWQEGEFTRMAVYRDVGDIHEGASGRVYFQSYNRVGYYDEAIPHEPLQTHRAHLTHITLADSLIYSGWGNEANAAIPALEYNSNSLRFNYGLISFMPADRNYYQYMLEGADEGWSEFTDERYAEYRNLREGSYTFKVRGRNLYRNVSEPAVFSFRILPPWYRSLWAYLAYGLGLIGLVLGFSQWKNSQLLIRQAELEAEVAARTEEVRRKSDQLEKLDKVKSTFFSNVSHEFRTPLTLIKGPVEDLMQDKNLSLSQRNAEYKRILENCNRLLGLIEQILSLSKMESGTYRLQLQRIDLSVLLTKIVGWYDEIAKRKGLKLSITLPETPVWAYADVQQIELMFSNLISNALKYTPEGSVQLHGEMQGEEFLIRISDTGIGIPEAEQPMVFDRYYRARSGLLSTSGSGIGLNLVKYVAELHGIELSLESEVGSGTRITLLYPSGLEKINPGYELLEDDASIDMREKENTSPLVWESNPVVNQNLPDRPGFDEDQDVPLVLIADDNDQIRSFIKEVLGSKYRFAECANGIQLIEMAREYQPDIILSDVMMPGMDGISAGRQIKADKATAHIPIIMITAKGGDHNELIGLESGANDYITKPFSPSILQARVNGQISLLMRLREHFRNKLKAVDQNGDSSPNGGTAMQKAESLTSDSDLRSKIDPHLYDPDFSVKEMCTLFAMSTSTLQRYMKKETGVSPLEYIRQRRIELASELLTSRKGNISEIAYSVGFSSVTYFGRVFKKQTGMSPSEFVLEQSL